MAADRPIADRLTTLGLLEWGTPLALDSAQVDALLTSRPHDGVVCLLGAAVERELVDVGPSDGARINGAWAELMASAVQLDTLLLQVGAALTAAGIDSRVLKGAAVAMLDEVDPSWRSYNDVDVLVPSAKLLAAAEALAAIALKPIAAPVGRRWASRSTKSMTLLHPSGMQVDVHRMLAAGPFGTRIRPGCFFEQGRPFEVGGVSLTALSDTHRFLHACYHAALGGQPGPRHRRDVLLLANVIPPSALDAHLSDGWSPAVVVAALKWADEGVDALGGEWAAWLAARTPDAADDTLLSAYGGSFRDIAKAELRATRGPVAKARYAAALAWPSSANLASRGKTRWQHIRGLVPRR